MATPEHMIKVQNQVRQNQQDLSDYIKDLRDWESDIKLKEERLQSETRNSGELPPVRNSLQQKKKKKKRNAKEQKLKVKPISGYDFPAWDKFDVDQALRDVDGRVSGDSSSSTEYETDEEWEVERRKQQASLEKDRGNTLFKKGEYNAAVECYTLAMECDPSNAILPANRAMALIKLQKYAAAVTDCTLSLSLDPLYIKAYLRRGSARLSLQLHDEALADYTRVLQLEPTNKLAESQVAQIKMILANKSTDVSAASRVHPVYKSTDVSAASRVHPVYKSLELRSKKPLFRVPIEEIGFESDVATSSFLETPTHQSSSKREEMLTNGAKDFSELITRSRRNNDTDKLNVNNSSSLITELGEQQPMKLNLSSDSRRENESQNCHKTDSPKISPRQRSVTGASPRQPVDTETSPRLPPVPNTSLQFQCDWKRLHSHPQIFYEYLKEIPPAEYPRLIGQFLEAPVLMSILTILRDFYIRDARPVYPVLTGLTKVKRFSMVLMFLSSADKKIIQEVLRAAEGSPHDDVQSRARLTAAFGL